MIKIDSLLKTALQAAKMAGEIIRRNFGKAQRVAQKGGSRVNLVTETDPLCEKKIIELIRKQYPKHEIVAEESSPCSGKGQCRSPTSKDSICWYIDPLDGTSNFAHGYPFVCVSIGVAQGEDVLAGVIYDPLHDELFYAQKEKGAYLNKKRFHVSQIHQLDKAFLGTGFPYDRIEQAEQYMVPFKNFVKRALGVRRDGAAALDLAYLAMGRFDGFWELQLHCWDMAAGSLLIREAGGILTDYKGNPFSLYNHEVAASNGLIHSEMLNILELKH